MGSERPVAHLFWKRGFRLGLFLACLSSIILIQSSCHASPPQTWGVGSYLPLLSSPPPWSTPLPRCLWPSRAFSRPLALGCSCINISKPSRLLRAGPALHRKLGAHNESAAWMGLKPRLAWLGLYQMGLSHPLSPKGSVCPYTELSGFQCVSVLHCNSEVAPTNALALEGWQRMQSTET